MNKTKLRFILLYIIVWLIGVTCLSGFLKYHYRNNFSKESLEEMIVAKAKWSDVTDDLCKFEIRGEPVAAGDNFIKLMFYCKDGRISRNTIAFMAFSGKKFIDVIKEFGRIIGFNPEIITKDNSKWKCFIDSAPLKSINEEMRLKVKIECYEK